MGTWKTGLGESFIKGHSLLAVEGAMLEAAV
jgi:hypothetical protein